MKEEHKGEVGGCASGVGSKPLFVCCNDAHVETLEQGECLWIVMFADDAVMCTERRSTGSRNNRKLESVMRVPCVTRCVCECGRPKCRVGTN